MDVLRTPADRFRDIPGFGWEPRSVEVDAANSLYMSYVDTGPADAPVVLLMHGEPSWSYLYRKMIPVLSGAGLRSVAPDLIGFGRSDKPAAVADYSYQRHVDWTLAFFEALDLDRVTLVGQDWGGLIGLRVLTALPDRFARVVAANTFLPTGDLDPGKAFRAWREFALTTPELSISRVVDNGTVTELSETVRAAYDAPFPDESYKAGARAFPALVPASPDDPAAEPNRHAWKTLAAWDRPFLTAFSDSDPITRGADRFFQAAVAGAKGMPHTTITGAGHFLQEDKGEELARVVADFVRAN